MPTIKRTPDDFIVDEIPAYEPVGEGDHLFVHFRKRGRTTAEVVSEMARALEIPARDVGVAGLKDKVAVTAQTISLPKRPDLEARLGALTLAGVEVLSARWHKNKLKTGHLRGNRFTIVVRDLVDVAAAVSAFDAIAREGVPNAFGPQRFGRGGMNLERACAWLSGQDRPPRDPKARRFSFSVWQSHVFNEVLARREADGTWASAIEGDLLTKHATGGMFVCTDVQTDEGRARAGEVSATGPMIGDRMRWPEARARAVEEEVVHAALAALGVGAGVDGEFLRRHAALGEGTRRPLRQWVTDVSASPVPNEPGAPPEQPGAVRVQFVLPSGAYATTVLARAIPEIAGESDTPSDTDPAAEASARDEGTTRA